MKIAAGSTGMAALAGCLEGGDDPGTPADDDTDGDSDDSQSGGEDISAWAFALHHSILKNLAESYDGPHNVESVEQPPGQIAQQLSTALQSQSNLPTASLARTQQLRPLSFNGGIVNLTDLVSEYEDDLYPSARARFKIDPDPTVRSEDGDYFGVPNDMGPIALAYNTEIFEEADLPTHPDEVADQLTTWDEFIEAGLQVEDNTDAKMLSFDYKGRFSGVPRTLMNQAGGGYYNEDREFQFNSDNNIRAMEVAKKLKQVNRPETWFSEEYFEATRNNEIATIIAPAWVKFTMKGNEDARGSLGDMEGVWRLSPIPRQEDSPRAADTGGVPAVIPAALPEDLRSAGRDFIEYWHFSEESVNEKLKAGAFPPINIEDASQMDVEDDYFGGQNVNRVWAESAENAPILDVFPNNDARRLFYEASRKILQEDEDIEQTLDEIHEQMMATFDP